MIAYAAYAALALPVLIAFLTPTLLALAMGRPRTALAIAVFILCALIWDHEVNFSDIKYPSPIFALPSNIYGVSLCIALLGVVLSLVALAKANLADEDADC